MFTPDFFMPKDINRSYIYDRHFDQHTNVWKVDSLNRDYQKLDLAKKKIFIQACLDVVNALPTFKEPFIEFAKQNNIDLSEFSRKLRFHI